MDTVGGGCISPMICIGPKVRVDDRCYRLAITKGSITHDEEMIARVMYVRGLRRQSSVTSRRRLLQQPAWSRARHASSADDQPREAGREGRGDVGAGRSGESEITFSPTWPCESPTTGHWGTCIHSSIISNNLFFYFTLKPHRV